jgi:hypothetical protein
MAYANWPSRLVGTKPPVTCMERRPLNRLRLPAEAPRGALRRRGSGTGAFLSGLLMHPWR